MILTAAPRRASSWQTLEPMNPNPPVTTHTVDERSSLEGHPTMIEKPRAKIVHMDDDEYQRMVKAGERHWWYRSTRTLLETS